MRRPIPFAATAALSALLIPVLALGTACGDATATVPVAYVASAGNNHVRVIDLKSGETVRRIYSGAAPWRLVPAPDGSRLWVQHWYAGTTAVIDLDDHEIVQVLPFRGPGTFSADGSTFHTFDWPRPTLARIGSVASRRPEVAEERDTVIREAYDVTPGPGGPAGELLYVAQYDPLARGPVPRYSAVAALDPEPPEGDEDGPSPRPAALATGLSPLRVVAVPGQPFLMSADSGTNGITVMNELGDRRALAVCPAPREIALAPDLGRMVVLCWDDRGRHASRAVSFRTDFTARPWPSIEPEGEVEIPGGLVAGAFAPSGERFYAVDRPGGRLLELALPGLRVLRALPCGSEPLDVAVLELPAAAVERLRTEESPGRRRLREALELARRGRPGFESLSWTETVTWLPEPDGADGSEGAGAGGEDGVPADLAGRSRTVRVAVGPPDALRTELPEGGVRVARGGVSVSLDPAGRFWTTPRQDLIAAVYNLPNLTPDEAIRRLAGDVPESRFLRGGLAVDLVSEVREAGARYYVIGVLPGRGGATSSGADVPAAPRVAQLWIDAETGLPTNLIEQFPVFERSRHVRGAAPEIAETKLYDYAPVGEGGPLMPRRLERVVEGEWLQHVRLGDFRLDGALADAWLDPSRLGGVEPAPGALFRPEADGRPAGGDAGGDPGRSVPVHHPAEPVGSPLAPHPPYRTSPPTSGPYLPFPGPWGAHDAPMPLPLQVHNLLDGGVALQYDCPEGCPALVERLEELARSHDFVIVAPYPWLPAGTRLAATAWGRIATFDDQDLEGEGWLQRVERFIGAYAGADHHGEGRAASLAPSH